MVVYQLIEGKTKVSKEAGMVRKPRKIDLDYSAKMRRYDLIGTLVAQLIPWVGCIIIFFIGYKTSEVLAGRTTTSQIVFGFLADIKTSSGVAKVAAYLFGASGIGYGWQQRGLRRKDIQTRSDYVKQLELQIDNNRTSSRLTKKGTTPREGSV